MKSSISPRDLLQYNKVVIYDFLRGCENIENISKFIPSISKAIKNRFLPISYKNSEGQRKLKRGGKPVFQAPIGNTVMATIKYSHREPVFGELHAYRCIVEDYMEVEKNEFLLLLIPKKKS